MWFVCARRHLTCELFVTGNILHVIFVWQTFNYMWFVCDRHYITCDLYVTNTIWHVICVWQTLSYTWFICDYHYITCDLCLTGTILQVNKISVNKRCYDRWFVFDMWETLDNRCLWYLTPVGSSTFAGVSSKPPPMSN